jgi:hypothetical protein
MALCQVRRVPPATPGRVGTGPIASLVGEPHPRFTNLTSYWRCCAFATGIGAVANGSAHAWWVVIGHGVAAMMVILLIPSRGGWSGAACGGRGRAAGLTTRREA